MNEKYYRLNAPVESAYIAYENAILKKESEEVIREIWRKYVKLWEERDRMNE